MVMCFPKRVWLGIYTPVHAHFLPLDSGRYSASGPLFRVEDYRVSDNVPSQQQLQGNRHGRT